MKVLNLYAGLGGNRKLWENVEVTAVESDPKIAALYKRFHQKDNIVVGDAHKYLLENYRNFDFIWTSPPCQSHSKLSKATRHKQKRYPDLKLYEEILFLENFFKGKWVVENVVPYYTPLIKPSQIIGRHMFWSNFYFSSKGVDSPVNFINLCNLKGKKVLMDWLGIHFEENIYYGTNKCPAQVLRNCVHPEIGLRILNTAMGFKPVPDIQGELL